MSADDDDKHTGKAETDGPPGAGRPDKPALTIDLAAEPKEEPALGASNLGVRPPSAEKLAEPLLGSTAAPPPPPSMPPREPEPPPPGRARPSFGALVLAAVVGGVIATVLGIAYHASGIVPTRSETVAQEALDKINALSVAVDALDKRVAAAEAAPAPAGNDDALNALTARLTALEKLEQENRTRIEKLEAAPAGSGDSGAEVASKLSDIETRLTKLESASEAASGLATSVSTLGDRVGGIEASVKALDTKVSDIGTKVDTLAAREDPAAASERAARAVAIGMLQQAAQRGGAFTSDLSMLKALGIDAAEVSQLEPLAAKDTPSVAALQASFPPVAEAIIAATSGVDQDAGFFDRLAALGGDLVSVRPVVPVEGDAPTAIVSRMQAAVDDGDLTKALAERETLPQEGRDASAAWAEAAGDRVAIDGLIDKLALSLTAPGN